MELAYKTVLVTGGTAGTGVALTRTWAAEFGSRGVRVNSVAPVGRGLPLGRTAKPEEIAHAVLFLVSPRSSFITGSTLHVDGGGSAI